MGCSSSSKVYPIIHDASEYHKSIARKNWNNIVDKKNIVNFFDNIFSKLEKKYPEIINTFPSLKDKADLFGHIILIILNNFDTLYDEIKSSGIISKIFEKNHMWFYYIIECFIDALKSQNITDDDIISWKVIMDLVIGIIMFCHR